MMRLASYLSGAFLDFCAKQKNCIEKNIPQNKEKFLMQ